MSKPSPNRADILLRIDRKMLDALAAFAAAEGLFSRAAAIRALLAFALDEKAAGWRDAPETV